MKKVGIVLLSTVALLAACKREENKPVQLPATATVTTSTGPKDMADAKINQTLRPDQIFLDRAILGSDKAADGTVQTKKATFRTGEAVRLTMWLRESPPKLQTHVDWKNEAGKVIATEQREMNGAKTATFEAKEKLKPGTYQAVGYWGGNIACQIPFTIVKK